MLELLVTYRNSEKKLITEEFKAHRIEETPITIENIKDNKMNTDFTGTIVDLVDTTGLREKIKFVSIDAPWGEDRSLKVKDNTIEKFGVTGIITRMTVKGYNL